MSSRIQEQVGDIIRGYRSKTLSSIPNADFHDANRKIPDELSLVTDDVSEDEEVEVVGESEDEIISRDTDHRLDVAIFQFVHAFTIVRKIMDNGERIVFAGFRKKDNLPIVIILATDLHPRPRGSLPRELALLLRVRGHPNVAEIIGYRVLSDNMYALLMRHYIECNPRTTLRGNLCCIARYMFQVMNGIAHLHAKEVAHRDICLDNMLYNAVDEHVVVNDLDLACSFRPQGFFKDVGREPYYPPEKRATVEQRQAMKKTLRKELKRSRLNVIKSKPSPKIHRYDERADIFSAGMMLYVLLNQLEESPEYSKVKRWLKKVKDRKLGKKHIELDLVLGMLDPDPQKRFSIDRILQHDFFRIWGFEQRTTSDTKSSMIRGGDNAIAYQAIRRALLDALETEPKKLEYPNRDVVIEDCSECENECETENDGEGGGYRLSNPAFGDPKRRRDSIDSKRAEAIESVETDSNVPTGNPNSEQDFAPEGEANSTESRASVFTEEQQDILVVEEKHSIVDSFGLKTSVKTSAKTSVKTSAQTVVEREVSVHLQNQPLFLNHNQLRKNHASRRVRKKREFD